MFSSAMIEWNSKMYMLYIYAPSNSKTFLNQDHLGESVAWHYAEKTRPGCVGDLKPKIRAHRCKLLCQDGEFFRSNLF